MGQTNKKRRPVKAILFTLAALAAIAAAIAITNMVMQRKKLLELLIPSDSNRIEAYSPQKSISLPLNDPYRQIKVVHFGDSHIQAGVITKKMRELLSKYVGEEKQSEGYVFPFNIAKTNSPSTYTFESDAEWTFDKLTINKNPIEAGIAGIYMQTTTPNATLTVRLTGYAAKNSSFNKLKIYYDNNPQSFVPQIDDSLVIGVINGDKFKEFTLTNETRQITISLTKTSAEQNSFVLTGMQIENCASKLIYSAAGLNGASAKTYLRAKNLIAQISDLNPNLIIISLGTNDSYTDAFSAKAVGKSMSKLIDGIKEAIPGCAILLTIPSDHYWQKECSNRNLIATREEIIKVAAKNGCYIWDLFSIMGGAGSMGTWQEQGYSATDMIHFTTKGYNLQAEMLFDALTKQGPKTHKIH